MSNISSFERAEILTQALPYIKEYSGDKIIVVKYGGNAMLNEELKMQVMKDIVLLSAIGIKVVLVHGGGPEMNDLMKRLGKVPEFVDGLRVTDAETIEIAEMVLAGKVNKSLVNLLQVQGGKAIGISGIDGRLIEAKIKNPKLGFVGTITGCNIQIVEDVLDKGYIPVISTVGCDAQGQVYNINGDTAAAFIAGALHADRLIMMTDIAGILMDKDDPSTLISEITIEKINELKDSGVIAGGMIPKVDCCINAIEMGVENVIIMDGRVPHAILTEILTDEGAGTMVLGPKE